MADREKVVKGLEMCIADEYCNGCPYEVQCDSPGQEYAESMMRDALELLKEQEPMQVKMDMYGNAYCPWCSTDGTIEMGAQRLHLGTRFCPYCGQAVKWND